MGYLCILFLFWVFAPFIVAFSAVAQLETLETVVTRSSKTQNRGPKFTDGKVGSGAANPKTKAPKP